MRNHFFRKCWTEEPTKKFIRIRYFGTSKGMMFILVELTLKIKRKKGKNVTNQWKKRSIFFNLPCWEFNLLHHNFNVLHIEKNVFNNVIYSLLNDKYKSKDHVNAQKHLNDICIRRELWLDEYENCWLGAFVILVNRIFAFLNH